MVISSMRLLAWILGCVVSVLVVGLKSQAIAELSQPTVLKQAHQAFGERDFPRERRRWTMARTPGWLMSPASWAAEFTLSTKVPVSTHSMPVCQPSTDGGFNISWPM